MLGFRPRRGRRRRAAGRCSLPSELYERSGRFPAQAVERRRSGDEHRAADDLVLAVVAGGAASAFRCSAAACRRPHLLLDRLGGRRAFSRHRGGRRGVPLTSVRRPSSSTSRNSSAVAAVDRRGSSSCAASLEFQLDAAIAVAERWPKVLPAVGSSPRYCAVTAVFEREAHGLDRHHRDRTSVITILCPDAGDRQCRAAAPGSARPSAARREDLALGLVRVGQDPFLARRHVDAPNARSRGPIARLRRQVLRAATTASIQRAGEPARRPTRPATGTRPWPTSSPRFAAARSIGQRGRSGDCSRGRSHRRRSPRRRF